MRIKAVCSFAFALYLAAAAFAQNEIPAIYTEGSFREMKKNAAGVLIAAEAGGLTFLGGKSRWLAPYAQIKTVYISLSRPSALTEVFGLGGAAVGAAKKRKLLLSIIVSDEAGKNARALFHLPEAAPADFISAIEERTGLRVVFESEEARQSITEAKSDTSVGR